MSRLSKFISKPSIETVSLKSIEESPDFDNKENYNSCNIFSKQEYATISNVKPNDYMTIENSLSKKNFNAPENLMPKLEYFDKPLVNENQISISSKSANTAKIKPHKHEPSFDLENACAYGHILEKISSLRDDVDKLNICGT